MKRLATVVLTVFVMLSACIGVFAQDSLHNECSLEHVTIIFEENSVFTEAQQLHITEYLTHDHDDAGIVAFGILCLFGHNYTVESATVITHCARATSPRCMKELFTVSICSRCDKTVIESSGYKYITCCP